MWKLIKYKCFVLSIITNNFFKHFKSLNVFFNFSSLKKNQDLYSIKNKQVDGNFIIETL